MSIKAWEKKFEKAEALISEGKELIEELWNEVDEYITKKSENWQESDKGGAYMDVYNQLEEQLGNCDDAMQIPSWEACK